MMDEFEKTRITRQSRLHFKPEKKTLYDLELDFLFKKQSELEVAEVYGRRYDQVRLTKIVAESKARLLKLDHALNSEDQSANRFDSFAYWSFCKKWLAKHSKRQAYLSAWRWYPHL